MSTPLHIGFIPLVDAAALIVAVDKGFTAADGSAVAAFFPVFLNSFFGGMSVEGIAEGSGGSGWTE